MSYRAVFLDRDGTLIEHFDYISDESQVRLKPRAAVALKLLKERGYRLVIISNQSAVARGLLTEKKLGEIHDHLKALLAQEGAYLDGIYYCPFHPEGSVEKFRQDSELRKPRPGMLLLAARELDLDLTQSWMIGDDDRDIEAGKAAGCRTILLEERGSTLVQRGGAIPDYQAVNLQEAANMVLRYGERPHRIPPEDRRADPPEPRGGLNPVEESPPPAPAEQMPDQKRDEKKISQISPDFIPSEPITISQNFSVGESSPASLGTAGETVVTSTRKTSAPLQVAPAISLRAKRKGAAGEADPAPEDIPEPEGTEPGGAAPEQSLLLAQILRELKNLSRERNYRDFSIAKLLAGLVQMVVFLCLVLAYRFAGGGEPDPAAALNCLVLGLIFQVLVLTLLFTHRS